MRQDAKEATRYIISTVPLPADKRVKIRKIRKLRNNGKAVSKKLVFYQVKKKNSKFSKNNSGSFIFYLWLIFRKF